MFALGVELLMRRALMTRWDDREEPEWPPHPDRVFMALTAGFGETGEDPAERAALLWLEGLGPPALRVPEATSIRTPFTSYVPVNDTADPVVKGKALAPMGSLPIGRVRQPRHFPTVVPDEPTFFLVWPFDVPAGMRPALEAVCAKTTYLGHSATPVRVWVEGGPMEPNLIPTEDGAKHRLRVFGEGRLDYLRGRFAAGLRPLPGLWQGYAPPRPVESPLPDVPFDAGLIVLRQVGGRKFALDSCGMVTAALRDTLMNRHGPNAPEWLTGHRPDGSPSQSVRPAILPLGFVGREHADGHLLGVALAVPRDFPPEQVRQLFDLLLKTDDPGADAEVGEASLRLVVQNPALGRPVGDCELELDERPFSSRRSTLRPDTWTGPAELWATATPLILPRFPRRALTPEEVVEQACREAGYPDPADVRTSYAPALFGVPHVRSFRGQPRPEGRPPRPLIHAVLRFTEPVRGPVVIGAGRYNGFGFCRPLREENAP